MSLTGRQTERPHQWLAGVKEPKQVLGAPGNGVQRLLPFLGSGVRHLNSPAGKELQTYLRIARLREQVRTGRVREICGRVLDVLQSAAIPAIILKGIAAAETVYPETGLRHCHDLDLLVQPKDLPRAISSLSQTDFQPGFQGNYGSQQLLHSSGFPVTVHTTLFQVAPYNRGFEEIWDLTWETVICGRRAVILQPEESLLHICVHAATVGSRFSPCWAADASLIIRKLGPLDWPRLLRYAEEAPLAIPLSVTLDYLAGELGAPIPPEVLETLRHQARASRPEARRAALTAILMSAQGRSMEVVRSAGGWRRRFRTLRWLLLPPVQTLRWLTNPSSPWTLPFLYCMRPSGAAVRLLARRRTTT